MSLLKEFIEKIIKEELDEAIYPEHFDLDKFKTLRSFKERVDYCNSTLKKLGAGSSRIVYQIDDKTVLKLAKNQKGIAQNEVEIGASNDYYNDISAEVYDYDNNSQWLEMELGKPIKESRFKEILGFTVQDFGKWVTNFWNINNGRKPIFSLPTEIQDIIDDSEFANQVFSFIQDYGLSTGDLGRISTYGEFNGEVKIIDYGLNDDVLKSYYRRIREELEKVKSFNKNLNENQVIEEAVYQGRKVPLYKIMRGDVSKFKVYVNSGRKDKDNNLIAKKLNFGHGGSSAKSKGEETMQIQRDIPERRKAFRARFKCDSEEAKDKTKKKYWNCKTWGNKKISDLT